MVKREFYEQRTDGVNLYRSYSTDGFKIRKISTDEIFDEAVDVEGNSYQYEETGVKITHTE